MTARIMLVALLCSARLAHAAPAADFGAAPTETKALAAAHEIEAAYRAKLRAEDRKVVDTLVGAAMKAPVEKRVQAAVALANAATMVSGQGADPSVFVTLAATAARLAPTSAVVWNDLGALLRTVDPRASVVPLQRALALEPAAIVYVNLGSSLAELGDRAGERALRRAIELEPKLAVAHESLAAVLLARGDQRAATAELAEAVADGRSSPNIDRMLAALHVTASPTPQPAFGGFSAGTKTHGTHPALVLPTVPAWSDVKAFLADAGAWSTLAAQLTQEALQLGMAWTMKYHAAEFRAGIAAATASMPVRGKPPTPPAPKSFDIATILGGSGVPSNPFSAHVRERFEQLVVEYDGKIKAHSDRYLAKLAAGTDRFKDITKPMQGKLKAIEPLCRSGALSACMCQMHAIWEQHMNRGTDALFAEWRDGLAEWNQIRPLMMQFWHESDTLLDEISDRPTFEYAEQARRLIVEGWATAFWLPISFTVPMLGFGASPFGACPDIKPVQLPPPSPPSTYAFAAQPATKLPCAIAETTVKIAGFTFKLSCEGGELAMQQGHVLAGVKFDWHGHEGTAFVGAAATEELGSFASVKAKLVATLTWQDGRIVDIGGRADVGAALDLDLIEGKVGLTATVSLATPPKVEAYAKGGFKLQVP